MIKLIKAEPDDISIIAPMVESLYIEDEGLGIIDPDHIRRTFDFLQANPSFGTVYLIYRDEVEVVGYSIVVYWWSNEFGGLVAILDELYVRSQYREKGYGSEAIKKLKDAAEQQGVTRIILEVDKGNRRAKRLYERLGFETTGRHHLITSL